MPIAQDRGAGMTATTEEQLQLLKGMTIRTGVIHEAQALQLRMWPLLIPGVYEAKARVDPEAKKVEFICKSRKFKKTQAVKDACSAIEQWVRNILWNDTCVTVHVNGISVFGSGSKPSRK